MYFRLQSDMCIVNFVDADGYEHIYVIGSKTLSL